MRFGWAALLATAWLASGCLSVARVEAADGGGDAAETQSGDTSEGDVGLPDAAGDGVGSEDVPGTDAADVAEPDGHDANDVGGDAGGDADDVLLGDVDAGDAEPDEGQEPDAGAETDEGGEEDVDAGDVEVCVPGKEACNGLDDDCDGATDEEDAEGCELRWYDEDHDGFGIVPADEKGPRCLCEDDGLWRALEDGDCDDALVGVHPEAAEKCNGYDDDCDEVIDPPGSVGSTTWYRDEDGDGWGTSASTFFACTATALHPVAKSGDCCDSDGDVFPGQTGWFAELNACGTFDYDCANGATKELTATGKCGLDTLCAWSAGWASGVPECGFEGKWVTGCTLSVTVCSETTTSKVQRCR